MKGYYKLIDEDFTLYLKVDCVINGKAICSAIEFGELANKEYKNAVYNYKLNK